MSENACHLCGSDLHVFADFGKMPIANGFLTEDQFENEFFYDLKVGYCYDCEMVQLVDLVPPEQLFTDSYPFFTSSSEAMKDHFSDMADWIQYDLLVNDVKRPLVVELGSNDGTLLSEIAYYSDITTVGVEPSVNVAEVAGLNGHAVIPKFFTEEVARDIVGAYGQADVIVATNTMCHIPDLHEVFRGFEVLLKPDGYIVFEDPYWYAITAQNSFDQIYDEHVYYFTVQTVSHLARTHEFEVIDALPQSVHGGSMRYVLARRGVHRLSSRYRTALWLEKQTEWVSEKNGEKFSRDAFYQGVDLTMSLVNMVKRDGKRVVGYGATSKSTTMLNYAGIGPDLIPCIYDTTREKQGKFTPGTHIPIRPYKDFADDDADYVLLLPYNHMNEILAKEQDFIARGGKFLVYVPYVHILDTG